MTAVTPESTTMVTPWQAAKIILAKPYYAAKYIPRLTLYKLTQRWEFDDHRDWPTFDTTFDAQRIEWATFGYVPMHTMQDTNADLVSIPVPKPNRLHRIKPEHRVPYLRALKELRAACTPEELQRVLYTSLERATDIYNCTGNSNPFLSLPQAGRVHQAFKLSMTAFHDLQPDTVFNWKHWFEARPFYTDRVTPHDGRVDLITAAEQQRIEDARLREAEARVLAEDQANRADIDRLIHHRS